MELRSILGERIRRRRRELGKTQAELADETGIPIQVLSRLEGGHQSIYVERLAALAAALSVSADYLLGLKDKMESERLTAVPA